MRRSTFRRRESKNRGENEGGAGRDERSAEARRHFSYNAIVGRVFETLVIAAVVVGALACPVMMLLGRKGIGPGCAMMNCAPKRQDEVDELRQRERAIAVRIAELEAAEQPAAAVSRSTD